MGAAGSSNAVPPSPSTPSGGRNDRNSVFAYGTGESYCPEYTNESTRRRTRATVYNGNEEPRSQGPSPYATLRGDEWWNQRPSAPSLSNLRPPQETLLTYASQMTGWQTSEGRGPSAFSQHCHTTESMELSRIISQLAMANQQLASAHNVTLAHLEGLYLELRKERESKRQEISSSDMESLEEPLRRRLTVEKDEEDKEDEEDKDDRKEMEARIDRLESFMAENFGSCRHRSSHRDDERKLRWRIEKLENIVKSGEREKCSRCAEVRCRVNDCRVESQDLLDGETRTGCSDVRDRILSSVEQARVPECEFNVEPSKSQEKTRNEESRSRVCGERMDHEEESLSKEEETNRSNLHLENTRTEESKGEEDEGNVQGKMIRLFKQIERSKAERLDYQCANERLVNELAEQKTTMEKLMMDYEKCKAQCEEVESRLQERKDEYERVVEEFGIAKKEISRLLKEIDAFKCEKDTAESRISSLEQDLQKSILEKEQIKNLENQKAAKLRQQLSEEVSDKKKQIKALEDALDEIQRLKETIKTERQNSEEETSKEDIAAPIESIDDAQGCSSLVERGANLEEFKKELTVKREARQRAIAAVSSEMERLRKELDAEKEAHSETSKVLDLLRSAQVESQTQLPKSDIDEKVKRSTIKEQEMDENEPNTKRMEAQLLNSLLKVSDELRNDVRFQLEKMDDLRYQLETAPDQHKHRILYLTEVTSKTREALFARERRTNELKDHLAQMVVRLDDRTFLGLKDDVGLECERQLENINSLKYLYNERLKMLNELKESSFRELTDVKERLEHSVKKSECLEEDLKKADEKIDVQDTEISNLESQLGLTKADCRDLQNQMSLINGLFTQMLLGATSADMDLDRLTQLLQENHDLICNMAREEGTEAAALPKLLLDLIEQVEGGKGMQKRSEGEANSTDGEVEKKEDDLQQEDIAHNLPKVWRVLMELLSCHAEGAPSASVATSSDPNSCYKSVDTPAGPRLVISVSKTYIRLKELILEKKHLEKEMNRMKQLNTHLESKLAEQEKRLSTVSAELSKTWTIVDRMQAQHQQLHTHEKILRYELQQKRKMLQELKQELEYCREKWESARQKNTNTELEWRNLRREFAARKALSVHDSFNNSAESGFSDERGDDTDEEDNADEGRIRLGPRRRRKENPRAPTPDTESEQPTDTELSESKTGSSGASAQRTPTPETEAELDETEVTNLDEDATNIAEDLTSQDSQDSLDPLDQALTNVIQNLIAIDDVEASINSSSSESQNDTLDITENTVEDCSPSKTESSPCVEPINSSDSNSSKISNDSGSLAIPSQEENPQLINSSCTSLPKPDGENTKVEEPPKSSVSHESSVKTNPASTMSVFSIGPFLPNVTSSTIKSVQFSEPLVVGPSNRLFAPVFGTTLNLCDEDTSLSLDSAPSSSIEVEESEMEPKDLEKSTSKSMESIVDSDSVSVDSSSSLETVKEFSAGDASSASSSSVKEEKKEEVSTSVKSEEKKVTTGRMRTPEEALAAREDRLKRLEEQAEWLMKKMNATSRRGSALSTRLEELHEAYGEPPVPPPMPEVLPSRRLRTNLTELPQQIPESSSTEDTENNKELVSRRRSDKSPPNDAP